MKSCHENPPFRTTIECFSIKPTTFTKAHYQTETLSHDDSLPTHELIYFISTITTAICRGEINEKERWKCLVNNLTTLQSESLGEQFYDCSHYNYANFLENV